MKRTLLKQQHDYKLMKAISLDKELIKLNKQMIKTIEKQVAVIEQTIQHIIQNN